MKRNKSFLVLLVICALILAGCSSVSSIGGADGPTNIYVSN